MGAIFGILQSCPDADDYLIKKMRNSLEHYPFDYLECSSYDNVKFGCGMQYITPESLHEKLPFFDEAHNLVITADAIIDNREELCSALNIKDGIESITDSEIILASYIKWRHRCPFYLVGDFAFAIWDKNKKELFCARDPMGRRTFYYQHMQGNFSFCTVMKPLLALSDNIELNERWITDFLAIPGPPSISESKETIYSGIYSLPPAHYLIFKDNKIKMKKYWDIERDIKPIRFKSYHDYEEAFRKVLTQAVKSHIRCAGEVGIMLSSGLDSSTVSCFAAQELKKQGKKLFTFTSVPMDGYTNDQEDYIIADESVIVREFVKSFDNMEAEFVKSEGRHALFDVERFIQIFEQPYKFYKNLYWMDYILEAASRKNCKVLLDGHFGNYSISFGGIDSYYLTLLKTGRFLRFTREMKQISKETNIPLLKVFKRVLKIIMPYEFVAFLKGKHSYKKYDIWEDFRIVNKNLMTKWNVKKRLKKTWLKNFGKITDYRASRSTGANLEYFSHSGAFSTALALSRGLVHRDPTKDRRVIEFTFGLPFDQFARNNNSRFLLRRAMKGILIDEIRLNEYLVGRQSADWAQRLLPLLKDILNEADEIIADDVVMKYLDRDRLKEYTNRLKCVNAVDINKTEYKNTLDAIVKAIIFARYIKSLKE